MVISIQKRMRFVYLLIDSLTGVFYVGTGNDERLISTLRYHGNTKKSAKMKQIRDRGDEVIQVVVYSSIDKSRCYTVEHTLIEYYKPFLVNSSRISSKYSSILKQQSIDIPDSLPKRLYPVINLY